MFGGNKPFSFSLTSTPANNTTNTTQSSTPFSFGNQLASTNTQAQTGGLGLNSTLSFGGVGGGGVPGTNTGSTAPSSGLFGSLTNKPPATTSTNLFGTATANTGLGQATSTPSAFNFGQSTSQAANTNTNTGSNLFSSSQSNNQFSFGGASSTINPPNATIGSTNNAPKPAFSFGAAGSTSNQNLFGQATQSNQQQAQPNTLTTTTTANNQPTMSSGFGLPSGNSGTGGFNFGSGTNSNTGLSNLVQNQPTTQTQPATTMPGTDASKSLFGSQPSKLSFGFGTSSITAPQPTTGSTSSNTGIGFGGFSLSSSNQPSLGSSTTQLSTQTTSNPLSSSISFGTNLGNTNNDANKPATTEASSLQPSASTGSLLNLPKPASSATLPNLSGLSSSNLFATAGSNTSLQSGQGNLNFTASPSFSLGAAKPLSSSTTASTLTTFPTIKTTQATPQTATTQASDVKPPLTSNNLNTTLSGTALTSATTATTTNATNDTSTATAPKDSTTDNKPTSLTGTEKSTITTATTLPSVLSFSVPSLASSTGTDSTKSTGLGVGNLGGINLGGSSTSSATTSSGTMSSGVAGLSGTTSCSSGTTIRSQLPKDQPIPQTLVECVENFKKHLEETRKIKELNLAFSSKSLHQNIQEIISTKQKLTQSRTELQRNYNETSKLKGQLVQELRHADICEHLKEMPLGLQYDNDIWNEYFLNRVQIFENKMRIFKNQFEQLEGYFKAHDREGMLDSQKLVETLKISHKNLLHEASNLKIVHEKVEELKKNYLTFKRNLTGDTTNIFESETDENQAPSISSLTRTNKSLSSLDFLRIV